MKSKNRYGHQKIKVVLITVLALLILAFCFCMMRSINRRMNESATATLLNTTRVMEGDITSRIESDLKALDLIGEMYQKQIYLQQEEFTMFYESMGFEWVEVLTEQNNDYPNISNNQDLSKSSWYSEWKAGDRGYSDVYYGESGRQQMTLWTPIYIDDQYIGTVFADVLLHQYYSASVFTFYEGDGRTYIFDKSNGGWILKSMGNDGLASRKNDLYSLLLESGNDESDIEEFREAVQNGLTGTATLKFNGEDCFICFMPVGAVDENDWYIATVIARNVLLKESRQVQGMIQLLFAAFCLGLAILGVLFVKWQNRLMQMRESNYREALFANISSNIDVAFLIYEKASQKTAFVSDNVKRILNLEREWLQEDAGHLFDWCGIEESDPSRNAFLEGTLDQPKIQEVCVENEVGIKARYIRVEMIPADLGQEIAVLTDITQDKDIQKSLMDAMRRAEEASQAKNEFMSSMSHDIRTPMNAVVGMTAIAAANLDDKDRVKDCLSKINDASAHLLQLINEILDMSRFESGKMDLQEEPFNLPQMLQEVLDLNYPGIKQKSQIIRAHIHSVEHEQVIGDTLRLQRVVTNLLSNAIKYTPECGLIEVDLSEKASAIKDYGCYEITVKDNGIGMSQEFLNKVFQPFEREQDVKIKKIQGTGLGMSIVKNIVSMMMGDIQVESEKNKGSMFRVIVHLKLDGMQDISNEVQDKRLQQLPVLVVDDDEMCGESVAKLLCEIGMSGEWVRDGEQAVTKVADRHRKKEDYLAVILDWKMPGMSGLETARRIRAEVDATVPIIILTAYDWSEIEKEGREAGIDSFLSKPIYKSKLRQKMLAIVDGMEIGNNITKKIAAEEIPPGKRVLVAEDNLINREIAVAILKTAGLEVDTVEDGAEVVEHFKNCKPGTYDIILMDIQMPRMDGYEATKVIRAMDRSDSRTIPIVAMTADAFTHDIQKAYMAGMNEHVAKPISVPHLMQVLSSFLADTGEQREE